MERITRAQLDRLARLFIEKYLHGRVMTGPFDHGAYTLDYYAMGGGYRIERINETGSGVNTPLGSNRRNARDMYNAIHFAMDTLDHVEREQRERQ